MGTESAMNAVSSVSRTQVYVPYREYAGGGSVTTSIERIREAVKSHNKWEVYQKEQAMCQTLAQNGYEVVHRAGSGAGNTYDTTINGVKADLKRTGSHNNIQKYAKHAVREQGAQITVFQFDARTEAITDALSDLAQQGFHGLYFYTDDKKHIYSY